MAFVSEFPPLVFFDQQFYALHSHQRPHHPNDWPQDAAFTTAENGLGGWRAWKDAAVTEA